MEETKAKKRKYNINREGRVCEARLCKTHEKKVRHRDDFDPRPLVFRGTASSRLPEL